jgi:DNA invertase Pin-like site-specific DNA recombinase
MAHKVRFLVAELGPDVDPLVLHLFAALAEKERALISTRTRQALSAATACGVTLGTRLQVARQAEAIWPVRAVWRDLFLSNHWRGRFQIPGNS